MARRTRRVRTKIKYVNANDKEWCTCGKPSGWTQDDKQYWCGKHKAWEHFWLCAECRKPSPAFISNCDTCGGFFKGKYPFLKFAYPCPDCEAV